MEATQGINPGRTKAEEAAKAVGGKAIFPIFAPGEQTANPKGFTDFNDLATKSELGPNGIERQAIAAVSKALLEKEECQERMQQLEQEQKQDIKQEQRLRRAMKVG